MLQWRDKGTAALQMHHGADTIALQDIAFTLPANAKAVLQT